MFMHWESTKWMEVCHHAIDESCQQLNREGYKNVLVTNEISLLGSAWLLSIYIFTLFKIMSWLTTYYIHTYMYVYCRHNICVYLQADLATCLRSYTV